MKQSHQKLEEIMHNFEETFKIAQQWQQLTKKDNIKAQRLWQKILERISPYIYQYPVARFQADEDQCSDFYLKVLENLENILINAIKSEVPFYYYFTRSMRNIFYKMQAASKKTDYDYITETSYVADKESEYNTQHLDDLFYHRYLKNNISNDNNEEQLNTKFLLDALSQLEATEKISIKLTFGIHLNTNEISYLQQINTKNNMQFLLKQLSQKNRTFLQTNIKRKAILKKLNEYDFFSQHRELTQIEKIHRQRLQRRYYQFQSFIPIREIAKLLHVSKTSAQRMTQKSLLKLKQLLASENIYEP